MFEKLRLKESGAFFIFTYKFQLNDNTKETAPF